jgi:glycerate kinase
MSLKLLVVPDKFKGTLGAVEAAEAMARGWRSARTQDALEIIPMSDGGDGFGEVLSGLLSASPQTVKSEDAAHRAVEATWWWHAPSQTAVIESAGVIGLAMLPPGKFHPFELDTFGLGALLRAAAEAGARRCLIGIGGSATNDGGFGMARALGWQFYNAHEEEITRWTELHRLAGLRAPTDPPRFEELIVAVDVENPLLGPQGCSRVYGPQKGLTEFDFAERCLGQLAAMAARPSRVQHAATPGAGAAGGLGYGLMTFLGARPEPGFAVFARYARLEERIRDVDLVLTGEGSLDEQSLMGKGVGGVAALCARMGVPCIGLAGRVAQLAAVQGSFRIVRALTPEFVDTEVALREPALSLERLARTIAEQWR